MKALITGARGHIGQHLAKAIPDAHLLDTASGWENGYSSTDVREEGDLMRVFDKVHPEIVYHLAGRVGRMVSEQAPALTLGTNILGTGNVARICQERRIRLIHLSSSEVYGPSHEPMHEDDILRPNNVYGLSKMCGEEVVGFYQRRELNACIVRPFMFYHEGEVRGEHRSAMIRFAQAIANEEPFQIHNGTQRGWLHYDDAIRFLIHLGEGTIPWRINLGHPDIRGMEELAELIGQTIGIEPKATLIDQPEGMTPLKIPRLTVQEACGFIPRVDLEEGVRRVCEAVTA